VKLLSLTVEHFRCVRRAAVEFGPGLNVLHGPNDLGKSSLAMAIRAALLMQASSREHEEFVNWQGTGVPHVELTFESEPQRIWRVRKTFGSAAQSYLDESRDGVDFQLETRGREVDGRLSEILQWGLAPPGGKGRPKGMPMTFLSTALLAEQDRVAAIFEQALSQDSEESGKKRLIEALQAVAEDPLYKEVLARVQARVDEAFTSNGGKRRGKGSPWAKASELIREKQERERQCAEQLQRTAAIENELRELHERQLERRSAVDAAQAIVEAMEAYHRAGEQRAEALGRLAGAKSRLDAIAGELRELAGAEERRRGLALEVAGLGKKAEAARALAVEAAQRAQAATAEVARQQGKDRARERAIKAAALEKRGAELRTEQAQTGATLDRIHAVEAAAARARAAENEISGVEKSAKVLEQRHGETAQAVRASGEREGALRAIAQLMRLRAIREGVEKAESGLEQITGWREEAVRKRAAAASLEAALHAAPLPSPALVADFRQLDQQLQVARARLDVGLHVHIRPKRGLRVTLRRDGGDAAHHELKESPLEATASREIRLEIDKIAEIVFAGGAQPARDELERLQKRWLAEAEPALERANAVNLDHLGRMLADAALRTQEIQEARRAAEQLEQRIADQPDWTTLAAARRKELAAAEAALGQTDRVAAEALARQLRIADAATADARLEAHRAERNKLTDAAGKLDGEFAAAKARVEEMQKTLAAAREQLAAAQSGVDGDWEEALPRLAGRQDEMARELTAIEEGLKALSAEGDRALTAAKEALARAEKDRAAADGSSDRAAEEFRAGERRLATVDGEIQMRREATSKLDEGGARAAVEQAEGELRLAPAPEQTVTSEMLAEARAAVQSARDELRHIEDDVRGKRGALEHVGGEVAKQRADAAREALQTAREREQFLEMDYAAWGLLRSTLLEAEREEGVHLGRALGDPIARRFTELTESRYGRIELGPDLETHGISVAGGGRPVSALSVGTRDQLSTIFRLSLAEQLGCAVMLDDQLTQSDAERMAWLRGLIRELAKKIQILVFTCRPADYLLAEEMKSGKKADGSVRSIGLKKAIERSGGAT
jgi:DNA repair exonuclease SbcCD ATPase subunit